MSEKAEMEAGLFMLRGIVASLPKEEQDKVQAAANEIRSLVEKAGRHGEIGLSLVMLEFAKKAE